MVYLDEYIDMAKNRNDSEKFADTYVRSLYVVVNAIIVFENAAENIDLLIDKGHLDHDTLREMSAQFARNLDEQLSNLIEGKDSFITSIDESAAKYLLITEEPVRRKKVFLDTMEVFKVQMLKVNMQCDVFKNLLVRYRENLTSEAADEIHNTPDVIGAAEGLSKSLAVLGKDFPQLMDAETAEIFTNLQNLFVGPTFDNASPTVND